MSAAAYPSTAPVDQGSSADQRAPKSTSGAAICRVRLQTTIVSL